MADEVEPKKDILSYRLIVVGLAVTLFIQIGGMVALPLFGKEMPVEASQIAILIIGGFLAFLNPGTVTK